MNRPRGDGARRPVAMTLDAPTAAPPRPFRIGLAARVLGLIVAFGLVAEVAIFIPSVASFRTSWLQNRLAAAYTAALAIEASGNSGLPDGLKRELLDSVGARMIVVKTPTSRRMLAVSEIPPDLDEMDDLRFSAPVRSIVSAFKTLAATGNRIIDIRGAAPMGAEFIEIAMDEAPLQVALRRYAIRIGLFSLAASLFVASLAVIALHVMVLSPVRRLTSNLVRFAADPQDGTRVIEPSGRTHEIGEAEHALADMERRLAAELREKKHLADLGLAVAKINHDLRNMLTAAQLLSDRLAAVSDPVVARNVPKLLATLDRAIRFCQTTLVYGRSVEEVAHLSPVDLRPIAAEALETAVAGARRPIAPRLEMPEALTAQADAEHMYRVLNNLCRNAVDVLEALDGEAGKDPAVLISGGRDGRTVWLRVCDTGPGLPPRTREKLFVPFQGSARTGGTGLGLAIAADLVHAQGGAIRVLDGVGESPWRGARFEISLPAAQA